jgi:hypothetical protein
LFLCRQIFDAFEKDSHLCRRFTVFVTKYNLMSKVCSAPFLVLLKLKLKMPLLWPLFILVFYVKFLGRIVFFLKAQCFVDMSSVAKLEPYVCVTLVLVQCTGHYNVKMSKNLNFFPNTNFKASFLSIPSFYFALQNVFCSLSLKYDKKDNTGTLCVFFSSKNLQGKCTELVL